MRIIVDHDRCEGHGLCEDAAPELFRIDDDGDLIALLGDADIPDAQREPALRAVRVCPISALRAADPA